MTLILPLNPPNGGGEEPDVAKAVVLTELPRIAEEGGAITATLEAGTFELRLADRRNRPSW